MADPETTQSVPVPRPTATLHLLKGGRHSSGDTGRVPRLPPDPTRVLDGARAVTRLLSARETRRAKETVARGLATAREVERTILDAFKVDVARFGGAVIGAPTLGYNQEAGQLTIEARVYPPDVADALAVTELEPHLVTPPTGIDLPLVPPPTRPHGWPAPKRPLPRWITRVQLVVLALTFAFLALAASRWGVPLRRLPHVIWFAAVIPYALGPAVTLWRHLARRPPRGAHTTRRPA